MSKLAWSLDEIQSPDPTADLTKALDSLLSEANPHDADQQTFEAAFHLFERHPLCDFGSPGPLIHWLERTYPRYVAALVASIERRPTEHTLWMVNRMLNANIEASARATLIAKLKATASRTDIEQSTVSSATKWLQRHA